MAWLEGHGNLEHQPGVRVRPTLERMAELSSVLGDPQLSYPVVHITGTNGKGSTARIASSLIGARGLSVGTYTSPDLARVNERLMRDGEPISDEELAVILDDLAKIEPLLSGPPNRFELLTAGAFVWFADLPVSVAVVEVGLGGRFDATNVVDAEVAVVTNVELDHAELLGPTRADIAREKSGIVKERTTLVLGETDPALVRIFEEAGPARLELAGRDFGISGSRQAVGGRVWDFWTRRARYRDVFVPLHGAHQGANALCALAATEALFDAALPAELVQEGMAAATSPGRLEVVHRNPLCVLDGAHNPAGAQAAGRALAEEFSDRRAWVLVLGVSESRDPDAMVEALSLAPVRTLFACAADNPRALPASRVAAAGERAGLAVRAFPSVSDAVAAAFDEVREEEGIVVAGSLYVVGEARTLLVDGG